ncbi:hypothetical protein AgCh_000042 [Apium graveolens]
MTKNSLERYTHYYEWWATNQSSRQKALADLHKMQAVHLEKLSEKQKIPESQLKFVLEAWSQPDGFYVQMSKTGGSIQLAQGIFPTCTLIHDAAPTEAASLAKWLVKDARVMTWILGSVDQTLVPNLRPYKTSKEMWEYLKKVYNQDNLAKRFQLEYEIAKYSQGDLSVQDFFSGFLNLWAKYVDIIYAEVSKESLVAVQKVHEPSKREARHIIKECPIRPQRRQVKHVATANQAVVAATPDGKPTVTPEMVQQMIIIAFFNIRASSNVQNCEGDIQVANGSKLPIHAIGDINSSIKDVLVSSELSTNLISVGQLVDNNCNVRFSHDGCCAGSGIGEYTSEGA